VPHNRLLLKVRAHGIDGKIATWIEEWLKEREQRMVLNGKSSQAGLIVVLIILIFCVCPEMS
jgi:hypothetical protein